MDEASAPERLRIPPDEAGTPRDLPRSFTPHTSAALDEMALTQVLTTIARRPYQVVGIVATDPFDVVFLAREVRRFCPNVRLFTIYADLLLSRPEDEADLRGMLVASTYPLNPSNQWITTPFRDGPRVFFSNRGAQGLYNATVAHLWEMGADEPALATAPSPPQLLEFALPYDVEARLIRQPPVWISAVGERGLYPVDFVANDEINTYLYNPSTSPEQRVLPLWPSDQRMARQALDAMKPNPHLLFWLLCWFLLCACLLVAGVTMLYARWSSGLKHKPHSRIAFIGFGHLLRPLICEVGGTEADLEPFDPQQRYRDRHQNPYRPPVGAGTHVAFINLLICGLSCYVFSHVIVAMSPFLAASSWVVVPIGFASTAISVVVASTVISVLEYLVKRPEAHSTGFDGATRPVQLRPLLMRAHRVLPSGLLDGRVGYGIFLGVAGVVILLAFVLVPRIPTWTNASAWRLTYERMTNLPSGVSSIFPAPLSGHRARGLVFYRARTTPVVSPVVSAFCIARKC